MLNRMLQAEELEDSFIHLFLYYPNFQPSLVLVMVGPMLVTSICLKLSFCLKGFTCFTEHFQ